MCTRWLGATPRKYHEARKPRCRKTRFVLWYCAEKRTLTPPYVCVYVGLSEGGREEVWQAVPSAVMWVIQGKVGCCSRSQRERVAAKQKGRQKAHLEIHACEHNLCIYIQLCILPNLCKNTFLNNFKLNNEYTSPSKIFWYVRKKKQIQVQQVINPWRDHKTEQKFSVRHLHYFPFKFSLFFSF